MIKGVDTILVDTEVGQIGAGDKGNGSERPMAVGDPVASDDDNNVLGAHLQPLRDPLVGFTDNLKDGGQERGEIVRTETAGGGNDDGG